MALEKLKRSIKQIFTSNEIERYSREVEERLPSPMVRKEEGAQLLYPWNDMECKTYDNSQGKYRYGYPEGAIIHYTASHGSLSTEFSYARGKGFCYFIIDKAGNVAQMAPLDGWGYHAGKSSCHLGNGVSKYLVGIEVICAGKLNDRLETWWGAPVASDKVRRNDQGEIFEKFTDAQERVLNSLLVWLKANNPGVFKFSNVLGHEEVSPGRKVDPGASFSWDLSDYRKHLEITFFK